METEIPQNFSPRHFSDGQNWVGNWNAPNCSILSPVKCIHFTSMFYFIQMQGKSLTNYSSWGQGSICYYFFLFFLFLAFFCLFFSWFCCSCLLVIHSKDELLIGLLQQLRYQARSQRRDFQFHLRDKASQVTVSQSPSACLGSWHDREARYQNIN